MRLTIIFVTAPQCAGSFVMGLCLFRKHPRSGLAPGVQLARTNATATLAMFVSAVALALTACGGGGGSTTPPVTVPASVVCPNGTTAQGTGADTASAVADAVTRCPLVKVTSVTPADGATNVSPDTLTSVVVATDGNIDGTSLTGANVKMKIGAIEVPAVVATDGVKGFKVTPNAKLPYSTKLDLTASVKDSVGRTVTVAATFTTSAQVLRYSDKVVAIWTGGQLWNVTKTGVKLVTNKTQYTQGGFPIANCWLPRNGVGTLTDGNILTSCQDAISLRRHYFAVNPAVSATEMEVKEYAGPVPATLLCTENADKTWTCPSNHDWLFAQESLPVGAPTDAAKAVHVSDGWYFNKKTDPRSLFFQNSGGATTLVRQGFSGEDDTYALLAAFSN